MRMNPDLARLRRADRMPEPLRQVFAEFSDFDDRLVSWKQTESGWHVLLSDSEERAQIVTVALHERHLHRARQGMAGPVATIIAAW